MKRSRTIRKGLLGVVLAVGVTQQAIACAFHGYLPNPTLVDVLMQTQEVVIARASPSRPGTYIPEEILRGPRLSEITIDPDQSFGPALQAASGAPVLLARDGAYGPWLELAVLSPRYQDVVTQVLQRQSDWYYNGESDRLRFFAALLNDPSPDVRRLALRELDRAPYHVLRQLRLPAVKNLRVDLQSGDPDLRPIRVLLAGLSKDRGFGPVLSKGLDKAIARDAPYLGAYATAMIELDGAPAVQIILGHLANNKTLTLAAQERLLEALAIQYRSASVPLRRTIAKDVATLARQSEILGIIAARQFGSISRWRPETVAKGTVANGNRASKNAPEAGDR